MRAFYFIVILFFISCNDRTKQGPSENQMSQEEEKRILKEEIDDATIEEDVVLNRNLTKRFLDYEKAKQIGLKETYQHEEPYSIVFLDGNNFVTYQAIQIESSDIESTINLFVEIDNSPLKINKTVVNGFHINFATHEYNDRKWLHSVIDIDDSDQRVMMQISSEEILSSEELMKKYLVVKRDRK